MNENKTLRLEKRLIDQELIDKKKLVAIGSDNEDYYIDLINDNNAQFEYVKELKPEEPNLFYTIISPKKSKKLYNETLDLWNRNCKPFYDFYMGLKSSLLTERNLMDENNEDIDYLEQRSREIETTITQNSNRVSQIFKANHQQVNLKELIGAIKEITQSSKGVLEVGLN